MKPHSEVSEFSLNKNKTKIAKDLIQCAQFVKIAKMNKSVEVKTQPFVNEV